MLAVVSQSSLATGSSATMREESESQCWLAPVAAVEVGWYATADWPTGGADVQVILSRQPDELTGAALHQFLALKTMGVRVYAPEETSPPLDGDLIIDALIGYSLTGMPSGHAVELIRAARHHAPSSRSMFRVVSTPTLASRPTLFLLPTRRSL